MNPLLHRIAPALTIGAAIATVLWLWRCVCVFPWLLWNELRLEPSFLLVHGLPVYPANGVGPLTTWIYGPVTPLLLAPATLAPTAAGALLSAAALNLAIVAGSVLLVCAAWPAPGRTSVAWPERLVAALLCLTLWPGSSLQYIQADNAAVACGLLGNLLLVRGGSRGGALRWWAAAAAVAAVACKQTAVGVLLAQLAWLAWSEGRQAAMRHALRALLFGAGFGALALASFGGAGLWLNLVEVPSHLPWAESLLSRLGELSPWLAVHLVVPALLMLGARRAVLARGSPLALAAFSWLAALPFGLAALLKTGGTINSLHSLLYFLPPAVIALLGWQSGPNAVRWRIGLAGAALALAMIRLSLSPAPVWRPITAHLRQADALAAQLPGEIWFPWNPLVTFYRERRLDHVEDGLYVRALVGQPLEPRALRAHLPPRWSGVALLSHSAHWGLALELCPADRRATVFGNWTLYAWPPAPAGDSRPTPPADHGP